MISRAQVRERAEPSIPTAEVGAPQDSKPPRPPTSTRRRSVEFLIKLAVSAALLVWVLRTANLAEVGAALRGANWWLLAASLALYIATFYVRAVRWRILLSAHGVRPSMRFLLNSYFSSIFFSNFLPSTIGGDALRGYDSWRAGASPSAAVGVLVLDRVFGMVVLLFYAWALLLLSPQLVGQIPHIRLWLTGLAAGMTVLLTLAFLPRVPGGDALLTLERTLPRVLRRMTRKFVDAFAPFRGRRDVLFQVLILSVIFQAATVLHYQLIAEALGLTVPLLAMFVIAPLAIIVMMLPISINAIGLREGAFVFLLAAHQVDAAQAVAFAWVAYGIVLLLGLVGGVVYMLRPEEDRVGSR